MIQLLSLLIYPYIGDVYITVKLLLCSLKKKVRLFGSMLRTTLNFSPILNFSPSFLSLSHISSKFLLSLMESTTPITLLSSNSSPMHACFQGIYLPNRRASHFLFKASYSLFLKWMIQVPPSGNSSHIGLCPYLKSMILLSISILSK